MDPNSLPKHAVRAVAFSQWAYWCSLLLAALATTYIPAGAVRTAVLLTPALTELLCVFVVYWLYRACDEYLRVKLLRCIATTAIIIAFCTLAYFILELLGFSHVSMLWVNVLSWSIFNVLVLFIVFGSR